MWGLIKNELLKLSRKSKLYIVIGFLTVFTAIQCYAQYVDITAKAPEKVIEECERLIENLKNATVVQTVIQTDENGETKTTNIELQVTDTIEDAKREMERARRKLERMQGDWRENLKDEIKSLETLKEEAIAEGNVTRQESIITRINMLNYHLERDIEPDEEYIMKNTVIMDIITGLGAIFLAIVVMMLTVETIAGENSSGTIKLLLTKPVSRSRIYLSKFLASLIASLGVVIAVEAAAYLIIGIIFGFGNMQAPAAIGTKYVPDQIRIARYGMGVMPVLGSTTLVPLWQKLIIVLALQSLFVVTIVSLGMFISALVKNGISAMIFGLLITAVLTIITTQVEGFGTIKAFAVTMPFLFSTYSAGSLILTGYMSEALSSTSISVPLAIAVMTGWAALFLAAGYRIFTRKDVLA